MEHLIIKLHGCSGAGKTTAARELMASYGIVYPMDDFEHAGRRYKYAHARRLDGKPDLYLIGDYSRPGCGGTDTIPTYIVTMEMVNYFVKYGHVLYEGLLLSTYYGAPGKLTERYGDNHLFAFLDTPADLCVERVRSRREAAGSKNKFDPQLTLDKHSTIERLKTRVRAMGRRVVELDHAKQPALQLKGLYDAHVPS
jgi:hypothetical protein